MEKRKGNNEKGEREREREGKMRIMDCGPEHCGQL